MDKDGKMMIFCLLLTGIFSPVFSDEWKATVVKTLDALVTSCVVVPCTFTHTGGLLSSSRLRGLWHRKDNREQRIYYDDNTMVLDNFKERTKLLGRLGDGNCTLEIIDMKDHDNGPFCFRVELVPKEGSKDTADKFSFVEDCVEFRMIHDPPKPTLTHSQVAIEGKPHAIICSVTHTCPSHLPKLIWSRGTVEEITEIHKQNHDGVWEVISTLTFLVEEKDDHSDVTCTAEYYGRKTSSSSVKLFVKRGVNYNHIIIPTVVGIITAVVFGLLCIFMTKKYKKRIEELQNQDGSMLNRLSRMSRRIRSVRPLRSVQRRPKRDAMEFDCGSNNVTSKSDQKISKPRFPSPKSQPKSCNYKEDLDDGDDYMNTAELNIYGNV